jgi:predicted nucleic acid-binding protein
LRVLVSVMTEAELLVRPYRTRDEDAIQRITDLLSEPGITVVEVTRSIARTAARLHTENGLRMPDAIIVATAVETRCDVIVGNDHAWSKHPVGVNYLLLDDLVRTVD